MDFPTRERLFYLHAYLRSLREQGLLKDSDATCKLFALVDDDRLQLAPWEQGNGGTPKSRVDVLNDLETHPERHKHTFEELRRCCMVHVDAVNHSGPALDLSLLEAHAHYVDLGRNKLNGEKCDVTFGPCACGASHFDG